MQADDSRQDKPTRFGHSPITRSGSLLSPDASPNAADDLTVLVHELAGMLDGSMRWLGLALQSLKSMDETSQAEPSATTRQRIETAHHTLRRMADLVDGAMRSGSMPLGSQLLGEGKAVTLGEAVDHAVDVVLPLARDLGVEITIQMDRDAGTRLAGPLYTVVLNALRNSIEAIERCNAGGDPGQGGKVEITARVERWIAPRLTIEVVDDGPGLPSADEEWAFRFARTTKPGGSGVGLALCRSLVSQAGGVIELETRHDRGVGDRPGALLRVTLPIHDLLDGPIG